MEFIDKSDIMKGIDPDTTADLLEKAMGHKYFKREGSPGNYKYYYTKEEYNKEKGKGAGKSSDTKEKAQYDIGEKVKFFDNGRNKNFKGVIKDYKEVDGKVTYSIKIDGRTDIVEGVSQKDMGKNV